MAINTFNKQCESPTKHPPSHSKGTLPSGHILRMNITADGSLTSSDGKSNKTKMNTDVISPYLIRDGVQLRVTEKKLYAQHKKVDFVSSFPLAASIYKANSDEFKTPKKVNKKVKKSVLTLPNESTETSQLCTVSDTNDSKYPERCDENRNLRPVKRIAQNRKSRIRNKNYEFYDRDAFYCSQMNISLDCSSTDVINPSTGDGKVVSVKHRVGREVPIEGKLKAYDVWAVLRNINRFQFRPSPPMSEDSIKTAKKVKIRNKRKNIRKDSRVIKTCHTKEYAYISRYDINNKSSASISPCSSIDRITVIDKQDEFYQMCKEFGKKVTKTKNTNQLQIRQPSGNKIKKNARNIRNNVTKTFGFNVYNESRPRTKVQGESSPITASKHPTVDNNKELKNFRGLVGQSKISDGILHSGSSKAAFNIYTNYSEDGDDKLLQVPSNESHIKGITKVILNKDQNSNVPKRINYIINPKLTQNEIKRRLANMKFPIVILGKDQVAPTSINVINYEYPHLQGLDRPIWPFMQDWYSPCTIKKANECENQKKFENKSIKPHCGDIITHKPNETIANKLAGGKDKPLDEDISQNKKKNSRRPISPKEFMEIRPQTPKRLKSIHKLKDNMLQLLYKNASVKDAHDQCQLNNMAYLNNSVPSSEVKTAHVINKVDVGIQNGVQCEPASESLTKNLFFYPRPEVLKLPTISRQPLGKARWASNFIETVMKRLRNGVYYNQENKDQYGTDMREECVQTDLTGNNFNINRPISKDEVVQKTSNDNISEVVPFNAKDCLEALQSFEKSLPALEIKTLNTKHIAVNIAAENCKTNVMVEFDIAPPLKPEDPNLLKKSPSFVSLTVTESRTKIFKCKKTIVNAMLPAEICSLLPKIILNIMHSNKSEPILSPLPYQTECVLYTISELSCNESHDILKAPSISNIMTPKLLQLSGGVLSIKKLKSQIKWRLPKQNYNECSKAKALLLKLTPQLVIPICSLLSKDVFIYERKHGHLDRKPCTALELYKGTKTDFLSRSLEKYDSRIAVNTQNHKLNFGSLVLNFNDHKIIVSMTKNICGIQEEASVIISNVDLKSIYQRFQEYKNALKYNKLNAVEYNTPLDKTDKQDCQQNPNTKCNIKIRKNKFFKLYKKCKSTSSISERENTTLLSRIENLEDFLQALGTGKLLSSIFDGLSEKKILSSILEMKSWITEISQKQAMLVLLLINKKDTPNLVRFRPILLQGIAVNRITRASELDMEIEVIETENFHTFSKYEVYPQCMSETVENKDMFMEELYWIAKTTASDYQRPFNEASEKLLKSLLQKRKKLNASYLRVMARYVGLGLLKSPNKN